MADLTTLRRSPLHHLNDRFDAQRIEGERGVGLRELPFLTMIGIRVAPGSPAFARLGERLGAPLPAVCGQVTSSDGHSALWLGPDEWLVVSSTAEPEALTAALRDALAGDPGAVTDVSANRTTLELSGPSARAVLEKGCPVDLHPRSFGPGNAVATSLGPVPLLLWQTGETSYRLLPRSSFSDYVARWLLDAASEYAGPEVP